MRWAGHTAHMREMKSVYKIFSGKPEEKSHLKDLVVEGSY
jgi:hypothetical protein